MEVKNEVKVVVDTHDESGDVVKTRTYPLSYDDICIKLLDHIWVINNIGNNIERELKCKIEGSSCITHPSKEDRNIYETSRLMSELVLDIMFVPPNDLIDLPVGFDGDVEEGDLAVFQRDLFFDIIYDTKKTSKEKYDELVKLREEVKVSFGKYKVVWFD